MEYKDIEKLFKEAKGGPINIDGRNLISLDRFKLTKNIVNINYCFLETNSNWKQGFVLKTKGIFTVNKSSFNNAIVLWEDTAPKEGVIKVNSNDEHILVYNVWDTGDGVTQAWHNSAAIELLVDGSNRVYNCNDGYPDLDLNDLIFSLSME